MDGRTNSLTPFHPNGEHYDDMSLATIKSIFPDFNHIWNYGQIFLIPLYQNSQKSARTDMTKVMSILLDYESAPKKRVRLRAIPTFAVTKIKSQRQTFDLVGIYLE